MNALTSRRGHDLIDGGQKFTRKPGMLARVMAPALGKIIDRIDRASDPEAEGIALAVAMAEGMLTLPGVVGINLSGGRDGGETRFAEAMATIADRLGVVA